MINLFPVDNISRRVDAPLLDILHKDIRQGPAVEKFERELEEWLDTTNLLTTTSGTVALQLALRTAHIGYANSGNPLDEVIVTPMTCAATVMPIVAAGARPTWADIYPEEGLINPNSVEEKINKHTRAVICVHWGGTPCDMERLRDICHSRDIILIEDAAHAFGALDWDGVKIGNSSADFTMFSFQALKHLTTIDGGALVVADREFYEFAKRVRWYGIDRESAPRDSRHEANIEYWGLKWHMNDVNATIGIYQLRDIDSILAMHRLTAALYWNEIDRERFIPAFPKEALKHSSFWLYTILLRDEADRIRFINFMAEKGIRASQIHTRVDHHTVFLDRSFGPLLGVQKFAEKMVCIPVHAFLSSEDKTRIIEACNEYAMAYK